MKETEKLLDTWKHPDPYAPPTAPGGTFSSFRSRAVTALADACEILTPRYAGSKYERNLPSPLLDRELPHPTPVGAAEANLGYSSSTIKILDIQSACAGAKGHCVHSGAVVGKSMGNKRIATMSFLRHSDAREVHCPARSSFAMPDSHGQTTMFAKLRSIPSPSRGISPPHSDLHFGEEGAEGAASMRYF